MLQSQGSSVLFSGILAVKLTDGQAVRVASGLAAPRHDSHTRILCHETGGAGWNPGGFTSKFKGLQCCKPFHLCIRIESSLRPAIQALNNFQQRPQFFVPSFYCGGAIGVARRKLNVTHKFQEPGKLRADSCHIQNAVGLDVHAI